MMIVSERSFGNTDGFPSSASRTCSKTQARCACGIRPPSTDPSMPLPSTFTTVASGSSRCFCNSSSDAIVRLKPQHQKRTMMDQAFRQLLSEPQVQKPISVVCSVDI